MELFRTKLVVKEAMKWTGSNVEAIAAFVGSNGFLRDFSLVIKTLEGELIASPGDWIVKGVKGEFYPCKPDVFAETYERVNNDIQNVSDERLAELICVAEDDPGDDDIGADMVNALRGYAALRASHKRLVEAFQSCMNNLNMTRLIMPADARKQTAELIAEYRAVLADARKLEGK